MSLPQRLIVLALMSVSTALVGCGGRRAAPAPAPPGYKPIALQLQQQDDALQGQRFRRLLDFERDSELVFVKTDGNVALRRDGFTGSRSASFDGTQATLRIGPVLFNTQLPGDWTLLGCYVKTQADMFVRARILQEGQAIATSSQPVAAGRWTFVSIDLTNPQVASRIRAGDSLALQVMPDAGGALSGMLIDDAILIDNARTLLDTLDAGPRGWKVSRRGHTMTIDAPGRFTIDATVAAASDHGWLLREYSPIRIIMTGGERRATWALFNDGRFIDDGTMTVKGAPGSEPIASHQAPATIEIDEASGRVNRTTDGDANNDGYNEVVGAYQISARQSRLAVGIVPAGTPVVSPVLEITGLPAGEVSVMAEGRLIESHARLADGRVLVQLPLRIERPLGVTVRVKN